MCHSCASRKPGCFVPAPVFLLGKRELGDTFWTAVFTAVTPLTRPTVGWTASSARGEASGFLRLKCYENSGFLLAQE